MRPAYLDSEYNHACTLRRSLEALIGSRPERTATLAVHPENAAARRLYESHGWHVLRERIGPAQGTHARMLMAKQLRYERV